MKKYLFWKIISIFFLIWLFLWLWNRPIFIFYDTKKSIIVKSNRVTGRTEYTSLRSTSGWKRVDKPQIEKTAKKAHVPQPIERSAQEIADEILEETTHETENVF